VNNFPLPHRIAILYADAKREYFPSEQVYISEIEAKDRTALVAAELIKMGIDAVTFPGNAQLTENLKNFKPDFVINCVDSVYGQEYLCATIPATLELLQIPYTGTGVMGMTINTNKFFTKNVLSQWGITTPKCQLLKESVDELDLILDFPLIAKLNDYHGSIEISDDSVCEDEKSLATRFKYLQDIYKQPVLVEEYIAGREVSVHVIEGINTKVYAGEKVFKPEYEGKYNIATYANNWGTGDIFTYAKYELPPRIKDSLKLAFDVLKLEDFAKFDLRVDASGRHYIIDVNTNPSLGPVDCSISTVLGLYGLSFEDILRKIILNTLSDPENRLLELNS
jgi:D-alanine-D-alanine ligase